MNGAQADPVEDPGPSEIRTLPGGGRILIRPLLASDREALAAGFGRLSPESRRRRFFQAPDELTEPVLDYLTRIDYDLHYALGALALDEPGQPGVGVARWVRREDDRTHAEPAITVLDEYQRRGVGTALLSVLAERAVERGVEVFVAKVLWENEDWLDSLRALGARVMPAEPGVASIEFDLAVEADAAATHTLLRRLVGAIAARVEMFRELRP
jgi:GNAT superfamily N-acetyltransferase